MLDLMSTFPNGFANGVSVRGVPVLNMHGGNVWWVDSATGSNSNAGTFQKPFSTLDYAIGRCTANNGDMIVLKANHAETITGVGGITADVAGITIVGLGSYNQRPRFLMDGAATVTFVVSAADVTVANCVFAAGHADVAACFVVTAAGFRSLGNEFVNNVADENFLTEIKFSSTTNNNADGAMIVGNRAYTVDANAVEFIEVNADIEGLVVADNFVCKDAATAGKFILCATGKDLTNCDIVRNRHVCGMTTGDIFIDNDTTANSGVVAYNCIGHHDTASAIVIDCDGVRQFENYSASEDTSSGLLLPAADDNT